MGPDILLASLPDNPVRRDPCLHLYFEFSLFLTGVQQRLPVLPQLLPVYSTPERQYAASSTHLGHYCAAPSGEGSYG